MSKCDFNKNAKQLYQIHTLAWVFSCKFAGYIRKLEIQFLSVNYTLVARICKNFEQNKPFLWCLSRRKHIITVLKVNKTF